jgi:hypothetical protein
LKCPAGTGNLLKQVKSPVLVRFNALFGIVSFGPEMARDRFTLLAFSGAQLARLALVE